MGTDFRSLLIGVPVVMFIIALWGLFIALIILALRALWLYISIKKEDTRPETVAVRKSLGETIKTHRSRCNMTQEFVAERLGVTRQAVSKWESGTSDPSTTNLLALAKLFDVPPEELLRGME